MKNKFKKAKTKVTKEVPIMKDCQKLKSKYRAKRKIQPKEKEVKGRTFWANPMNRATDPEVKDVGFIEMIRLLYCNHNMIYLFINLL